MDNATLELYKVSLQRAEDEVARYKAVIAKEEARRQAKASKQSKPVPTPTLPEPLTGGNLERTYS